MMTCVLCGESNPNHPLQPTDTLLDLIHTRACRGPIVYPIIMAWDQPTICVCRPCFLQLRRVKPRRVDRQPLPLDAAVLQTIIPGTMRQQDSRTRERICRALTKTGNAYSKTFEALSSLLERGDTAPTTRDRLGVWWKYNLQTECFSHKAVAKHVRRCGL